MIRLNRPILIRLISLKSILTILFCTSALISSAQQELGLADAIRIGLERNYQIRVSEKNVEIAENNNSWGLAGRYPLITLGVRQGNRYDNTPQLNGDGRSELITNTVTPNINLNWTLFDGFAVNISKEQLELLQSFTKGNASVVVENTIQAIVLAYYKVLLEQEKLSVLRQVKNLSRDRFNYQIMKKEIGSSVTYDVLQAEDAFLSDSTNFLLQQLNLKNALLNLHLLLAEDAGIAYQLTDTFAFDAPKYQLPELMERMTATNKNLLNQYINQEILKKEVGLAKSSLYPSLSLNAGADHTNSRLGYAGQDAAYRNSFDVYANLSLSFNLSNGGNVRRAIENAEIEEQIGRLNIAELEQTLSNLMINYYELYSIQKQLLEVAEVSVESSSLNLEISSDKFKAGAINSFNYRDVQLTYLNAAIGRLEAIYNLVDTHTELLRLTGGIIEEY